jgi:hypothetical protein
MLRFRLIRGDAILGVVTHAREERIDGARWDVGWIESAPDFEEVRRLFEQEQQLLDQAVKLEVETGANAPTIESAFLLKQAGEVQREIMEPGVLLVDLSNGKEDSVDELHIEGSKVIWR